MDKKRALLRVLSFILRSVQGAGDVGDGFIQPLSRVGYALGKVLVEIAAEDAQEEIDDALNDFEHKAHFKLCGIGGEHKAFIVNDISGGIFFGISDDRCRGIVFSGSLGKRDNGKRRERHQYCKKYSKNFTNFTLIILVK